MNRRRRPALLLVTALLLAACSSGSSGSSDGSTTTSPVETTITEPEEESITTGRYLSLGDSYAEGFGASDESLGYAALLPDLLQERGFDLELVNLACGGEQVHDLTERDACPRGLDEDDTERYAELSQLDAAIDLLTADPGAVKLITVSIGGNDVTACVAEPEPVTCVADAVDDIDRLLRPMLEDLRQAAGPDTVIIGLTYPDVILGLWIDEASRPLAELSVTAFRDFINPTLSDAYASIDGIFVDVTEATDAYVPLDELTDTDDHGEVPVAVARVCELTWFCEDRDIHPNDDGYAVIADLIVDAVPTS